MLPDAWLWIFVVIIIVALLFLMVYNLLAFDELKHDHKNPVDVCNSLNPWVVPEFAAHALLTFLLLIAGDYFLFAGNLILVAYHANRYAKRPSGMLAPGIYDPTEIFNHGESKKLTIECIGKLAFYMVSFFYYLYCMMYALLSKDD